MAPQQNPHWGTPLDKFLTENGTRESATAEAMIRVVAWQLAREMEKQGISGAIGLAHTLEPRSG